MEANKTRQIIEGDSQLNTSASIYSKWAERFNLDAMQSSRIMSFEGLSLQELLHLQNSLTSAMNREAAKLQ